MSIYTNTIEQLRKEIMERQLAISALSSLNGNGENHTEPQNKFNIPLTIKQGIMEVLSESKRVMTPSGIYEAIGKLGVKCLKGSIGSQLHILREMGAVYQPHPGAWAAKK